MTTVTKYIAFDGKEFINEAACEEYELLKKTESCNIAVKTYDFVGEGKYVYKRLNTEGLCHASAVLIKTDKDYEALSDICEADGVSMEGISSPGCYVYDEDAWCWVDVDLSIENYQKRIQELREEVRKLNEVFKD